ncbi:MAG TPA: hypothetical protein VHB77_21900 [Planctomycetaceae bacterium]|jgi:hypothetical protein|nr:hypothetical protein [Planctomycetaceae bacterium]
MSKRHVQLFVRVPDGDDCLRERVQEAVRTLESLDCSIEIVDLGSDDREHLAFLDSQECTRDPLDAGFWSSLRPVTVKRRLGPPLAFGFLLTDRPDLLPGLALIDGMRIERAA